MTKEEILEKLKDDQHYYGEFGQQFLSNSNISTLLSNPLLLGTKQEPNVNFAIGGYFHTMILEPDKLEKYKVIDATTRNTNKYKEYFQLIYFIQNHQMLWLLQHYYFYLNI